MSVVLSRNSYGKSHVRLTKVARGPDRHVLTEWDVAIQLEGDFTPAYTVGDNRQVIATDTMKNTVYVLASDQELTSPEAFAQVLTGHFVGRYPQVSRATVEIESATWKRIVLEGKAHPHAFESAGSEVRTCRVEQDRQHQEIFGGLDRLLVLKTTDSAWRDFHRDEFRTLPDADDRILATEVRAGWRYLESPTDADDCHARIRQALVATFARHNSLGVQHTLLAMGEAALTACPAIEEITLTLPNRHRIPFDLRPFGRENRNSIFVATDEPHGLISGTLRRSTKEEPRRTT